MTEKLYWTDPLATSFEVAGAESLLTAYEGKPSIVLPRTLFYPEGGGQLGDSGVLVFGRSTGGASEANDPALELRIADTQVDPNGVIHHVLDDAVAATRADLAARLEGARSHVVRGVIDDAKRRDHMVQHTAQHALSRALADEARADTVSARLGATTCTIDVSRPGIAEAALHRAEDLVNAVIMSDVAVNATFPTAEELASLDLRKQPNAEKSARGVRVVTIDGFDVTPCGGTHCTRSGQIGHVRIVALEKYKGMLRITFQAGRRALADGRARQTALAAAASELTCGALDVPTAIAKLRGDLKGARTELEAARTELSTLIARELLRGLPQGAGPHVLTLARPESDLGELRMLANKLTEDPRVVAVCATSDRATGDLAVVIQRGKDANFDCGAFLQAQTRALGGRGGGRPERAEGRFPRETTLEHLGDAARRG